MTILAPYLLLLLSGLGFCYLTPWPASITPPPAIHQAAARGEVARGQKLRIRDTFNFCDTEGFFYCPTGTCYEDQGLIGCCSVSSCAPRTTCIEYNPGFTSEPCDRNTGGCLYCNDPAAPYCRTQTNPLSSQYNHYCDAVGGTVTATAGAQTATTTRTSANVQGSHALQPAVATSSGISIQTMAPLDTDTAGAGSGNSPSYGAIAGIACGVGAALALTAAAFWYFWSRKRSRREEEREKHRSVANAPPPSADRHGVDDTPQSDGTIAKDSSAIRPMSVNAYDSIKRFTDDFGSPLSAPAYSANDANGYTVTNPDLNPTPPTESSNHDFSTCHASAVEAPSDWPLKLDSPPASAHVSNHTPPSWTNSQYASLLAAHTPYTPSRYHASAPNSIAKPFLQPPSLPQAYSAATFASDASRAPAGQYTPSNYQPGAPESVARAAPPSVPQEYSTATLSPDDIDGSPVYRGLRSSSSNAFPPYAYLSPEDALAGGWRNESPPRSEH